MIIRLSKCYNGNNKTLGYAKEQIKKALLNKYQYTFEI